ncbi:centrosomal protein of 135 kDa-like isoform X2 [Coccinella septempunctata]|uniref:centrosomal protein of 135 kDa-like isoform X2 n=1 Tax=Coccinella septempunctata TaxID=41139 RepID=UPI001D07FC46|nr:centrosomal protein of 135 kDa-like isoform X2 [Coccinella septempunctata]
MEAKFFKIRRDLDSLGYFQILSSDCLPLVEKLLDDLKTTTASLQKYIKLAQRVTKEKEDLELTSIPHKFDNEKVLREYNDLQLTYSNYRSQKERDIKELRNKVLLLNEENAKLILDNEKLRTNLRETELDLMKAGARKSQQGNKGLSKSHGQSNYSSPDEDLLRENNEIRHELDHLKKELKNLQCKCHQLESIGGGSSPEDYEEEEVVKRKSTLDNKYTEDKIHRLEDEIHNLTREKNDMEKSYREALSKQHEAMKRAIHLAERNKELEKELKDIDRMAIAVEEECNDAVKNKTQKLTKLEMALKDALQEIQTLERTIAGMKKDKQQLEVDNDILRTEKKRMQDMLTDAVKEKSDVLERMNGMKLIEHDLNLEIDRLVQESNAQKRVIAELESKIVVVEAATFPNRGPGGDAVAVQVAPVAIKSVAPPVPPSDGFTLLSDHSHPPSTQQHNKSTNTLVRSVRGSQCSGTPTPQRSCTCVHEKKPVLSCACDFVSQNKCCVDKDTLTDAFICGCMENMCLKHFQDLMRKEIEQCQCQIKQNLMKVTQEKDHYMEEYHKLVNQMCQVQIQNTRCSDSSTCPVCPKTQQIVEFLQHENKMLSQEKMMLVERLEKTRNDGEIIGKCNKSVCKRMQRERDLFKADVARLEEECDCLRENIQMLCDAKTREHDTFSQQIKDYERRMKKIESERGELMNAQGSRRAQIDCLEEKNEMLKNVLRTTQDDLQNQKIIYGQLKNLHDQTDKALHDAQAQLVQVERQLAQAYMTIEQLKKSSRDQKNQRTEIDLDTMKRQLNRIDQEKDELLNIVDSKTEEIASLKEDLRCKCGLIEELRGQNADLKNKLGNVTDRAASSNANLRDLEAEISRLQKQLDVASKTRDNALEVNRKLQDELATVSREANIFKAQLTKSQDQIENLKLQSQQYIAEVKRAEDLIEAKEKEREELLNQFKQLCLETNHLQSSNSALESEANQSKVQLSVAMDHVHDLEQRGETLETLINDYEKQIGLLTNQIAKFESERSQHMRYQDRTEAEIKSIRELCMKLDRDKEQLRMQLLTKEKDGDRLNDLRRENEILSTKLTDSQTKLASTERLFKEARHEGVEMKLKDEEALNEINLLKERIDDLERRLFQCTCGVCPDKCIGGEMCDNQCMTEFQGQITTASKPQELTTREQGTNTPSSPLYGENPRNDDSFVAEVHISEDGDTETIKVHLNDGDGELLVEKKSVRGVTSARPDSVSSSPKSAVCDCRSSDSSTSNGGSKKSIEDRKEIDKLRASLTEALIGGQHGKRCREGKCQTDCKLFDPLNKVCGRQHTESRSGKRNLSKNYKKPIGSEEKDARIPCCPSTCRCNQ